MRKYLGSKKLGRELEKPVYQFLTNEELEEAREEMRKKALEKLQMPPVMEERNLLGQVLERDPQLTGFDTCKYVFTDITFGVPDRSRLITVRDPDGTLRMANRDEQDRLNESYFPRKLRKHYVPQMFEPENLEKLLGPEKYEYILDRNCLQFEPDNAIYIKVAETVYQHVNQTKNFDSLHSTRHFGPLMFYLTWTKQLDESIVHFIRKDSVDDAAAAITLHTKIHQDSRLNSMPEAKSCGAEDLVRLFAKYDSVKSSKISMALDKLIEVKEMNKRTKSDILESHGAT